jgi:hypothetical protein
MPCTNARWAKKKMMMMSGGHGQHRRRRDQVPVDVMDEAETRAKRA